jgi:large subunit ribosomal protein L25
MKLHVSKRTQDKKSEINALRREGKIPAVLYSSSHENQSVIVDGTEFAAHLRQIPQGRLSTTIFTLVSGKEEVKALVKDIQYHPTTYQVLHMDFVALHDNAAVRVKVPVECTGAAECQGIKLGGFLRQVIRYVKVECLPKNIPAKFEVDVRELSMKQSKRVEDIKLPAGIKPLVSLKEVVVVIAKR